MIKKIILKSYRKIFSTKKESSFLVNKKIIDKYTANPNFPYLVSFSRTGSHWLRNIMELYFLKPALVRIFYYKNATDFTCLHSHDIMLDVIRKNVIYLYRNPIDTIYSQIRYHKQDINNQYVIKYWASLYGQHLSKWLLDENFTNKKTVITYENMKKDLSQEFIKVCEHLGYDFDK
jgi:hypothetical protein